jgi:hypothetical protein
MKSIIHHLPYALVLLAAAGVASVAIASEYLTIPAAGVLPRTGDVVYDADGICIRVPSLTSGEFLAPVELPNGAVIDAMTLEAHDAIGGEFGSYVEARLIRARYFAYGIICDCTTGVQPAPGDTRVTASAYGHVVDNTEYSYYLWVLVNNTSGTAWESEMFYKAVIRYNQPLVGIPTDALPAAGQLENFPNPFNPSTTTVFALPDDSDVRLSVYDLQGARVRTLLDDRLVAGEHRIPWDGRDDKGASVASGVYLLRLETAAGTRESKVTLVR